MNAPRPIARILIAGVLATILTTTLVEAVGATLAPPNLPADGWTSWDVKAMPDTPAWCCYEGWNKSPVRTTCQLDNGENGYSSRSRDENTREVRVYAKFTAGSLTRLRTLAASCDVAADTPIAHLENVSATESVNWLKAQIPADTSKHQRTTAHAIAAIAMHQGELARDTVSAIAKSDAPLQMRKDAVFWLTQVRGAEGFDIVAPLLFNDADPKLREQAAFALSHSQARPSAPLLIRSATTDRETNVRARAWFWLAQTQAAETEGAIRAALPKEQERRVHEQMIFALSQLPAERAAPALIAVAEDKSLPTEDRKKAIFWMSRVNSDVTVQYLDKVLAAK